MRRLLLGALIFLTCASECSAHGAIAYGYNGSTIHFVAINTAATPADAETSALQSCLSEGLVGCRTVSSFQNTCMAVAVAVPGDSYSTGEGSSIDEAQQQATKLCRSAYRKSCFPAVGTCDEVTPPEPDPPEPEQQADPRMFGASFFRYVQTELAISGLAKLILLACCLWLFVSLVSTAPAATLRRTASLSAWIGIPAALGYATPVFDPAFQYVPGSICTFLFLWTNVYVALILGGKLRRYFSSTWRAPDPFSLPLAALTFAMVTALAVNLFDRYGTFPEPDCGLPPYPAFSICHYFLFEGFCFCVAAFVLLVICGAALPARSNLVLAYDSSNAFLRKVFRIFVATRRVRRAQREIERANQPAAEPAASYPVPAIYETGTVDKMCLKLKRSQRSGLFGKPFFVLDARMEVTAEEAALVSKYGLGDDVIYESSSRQQRKKATLAQLELTRDTPGFSEPATKQLLGLGKTLYRLTRAGVSATAAALSLRVTVRSLMSGVHVECKSMAELLDAEKAILEAAQNLRSYLDTAATFDGREEIIEF
jgi:uncharacterized protein DUF4189